MNAASGGRRVPGQLYILLSFIPWILYWVLSGFTGGVGVVAAFVVSIIIIIPQLLREEFSLMDFAAVLYFSVAVVAVFAFGLNVFVEKSGFLGYLALFLMAVFSLAIKQPFTFQVSKRLP
jgi:all-trans-retinol 13,14-reductase